MAKICPVWAALVVVLLPAHAAAEHGSPFLLVAPAPDTMVVGGVAELPLNARIRIRTLNGMHWIVRELAHRRPTVRAVLVSGTERVPLAVTSSFDDPDGYGEGLVSLRPLHRLRPRTRYELSVSYQTDAGATETVSLGGWTTTAAHDVTPVPVRGAGAVVTLTDDQAEEIYLNPASAVVALDLTPDPVLTEVIAVLVPVGGGRALRIPFLFDATLALPEGPTADYHLAVARGSQPHETVVGGQPQWCLTSYYTGAAAGDYRVRYAVRDVANNRSVVNERPVRVTLGEYASFTTCVAPPGP